SSELVARGVRLATIHWPCQGNNHGQDHMGRRPKNARLIFVSHSGQDTWVARQIANGISAAGARPFLDEADVNVGADFEEDILGFLDKAHELVVLFTPWSLGRPYVWAEIGAAWIRRIPIVVVLHGLTVADFQANPNAPVFLKRRDIIL